MTIVEIIFTLVSSLALLLLFFLTKNINWKRIGLRPQALLSGWWQILLFNIIIFLLIQLTISHIFKEFPAWMTDKDSLLSLLIMAFIQEMLFRSLLISWLEPRGRQKALWISTIVFALFHLVTPNTWSNSGLIFAGLTFIGGLFWGWHFLRYRNIYLLTISHLLVNLSLNYLIFIFLHN